MYVYILYAIGVDMYSFRYRIVNNMRMKFNEQYLLTMYIRIYI